VVRARSLTLLFFAAIAACLPLSAPVDAGVLRCDSKTMSRRDYDFMKSTASKAARGHTIDWRSLRTCMNPGRGRVWMDAIEEPQADGSVHAPAISCERDHSPWKCEVEPIRLFRLSVPYNGREQPFVVQVPMDLEVEDIRVLTARSFEMAQRLTWKESCAVNSHGSPSDWDKYAEEGLREFFAPRDEPIWGWIQQEDDFTSFSIGLDISLNFSQAEKKASDKAFKCWERNLVIS